MKSKCHLEALCEFEEGDTEFEAIQTRLSAFQSRHSKNVKSNAKQFEWIEEERKLRKTEAGIRKELDGLYSKLSAELVKEIEPIKKETEMLEDGLGERSLRLATEVEKIKSLSQQGDEQADGLCTQMILDVREKLSSHGKEIDEQYSMLAADANDCRRTVLQLMAEQSTKNGNSKLPPRIAAALGDASIVQQKILQLCDNNDFEFQIQMLTQELNQKFDLAKEQYSTKLGSLDERAAEAMDPNWDEQSFMIFKSCCSKSKPSLMCRKDYDRLFQRLKVALPHKTASDLKSYLRFHEYQIDKTAKVKAAGEEYAREMKRIEDEGMKRIESLRTELEAYHRCIATNKRTGVTNNDLRRRIQAQRAANCRSHLEEVSDVTDASAIRMLQRNMSAKQHLWNVKGHITEEATGEQETEDYTLLLSKQRTNRERTQIRELQRQDNIAAKAISDREKAKAAERRLERLSALQATVPYFDTIKNAVPDIHKSTEARKNDVYTIRDASLADFQSGQMKSFTNDKLFSDSKFRLANALHEAGVAQTIYARNVVRNVIPRESERTTGIKPY